MIYYGSSYLFCCESVRATASSNRERSLDIRSFFVPMIALQLLLKVRPIAFEQEHLVLS